MEVWNAQTKKYEDRWILPKQLGYSYTATAVLRLFLSNLGVDKEWYTIIQDVGFQKTALKPLEAEEEMELRNWQGQTLTKD